MTRRTYGQFCALSQTLDLVGERWALLVIRELGSGPKRYSDILDALPGIGTSLLARRLQTLEKDGFVRKRELPPPLASTVYELSDLGRELLEALIPLVLFGARNILKRQKRGQVFRPEWPLLAFAGILNDMGIDTPDAEYEFRIGKDVAHLKITKRHAYAAAGAATEPKVILTTDPTTFIELGGPGLDPAVAIAEGRMRLQGHAEDIAEFARIAQPFMGALRV